MTDLIVVGAGLFGSAIGRYAQARGMSVRWVDSQEVRAASPASAGLFKPSWLSGMSTTELSTAMTVLEELSDGIRTVQLKMRPTGWNVTLSQVSPERIMAAHQARCKVVQARVLAVRPGVVTLHTQEELEATHIVVAAGVGCNAVEGLNPTGAPPLVVTAKAGVAFLWKKRSRFDENRMEVWAPYKQTMVVDRGDGLMWGGDGSALKPANLTPDRMTQSAGRVGALAGWNEGKVPAVHRVVGYRPFVDGCKGGLLVQRQPGVWVATGGGKIGTVAAGLFAQQWAQRVGLL